MSPEYFIPVQNELRRANDRQDALERELGAVDSYIELDEIQLVNRYDEIHKLEQQPLVKEQRQMVDFISHALLDRIEHKITPSFRRQLEQEAQQTNFLQEPISWES